MTEYKTHPFQIGVQKNEPMGAYDITLQVGGFRSAEDAHDWSKRLVDILRETGWSLPVQ